MDQASKIVYVANARTGKVDTWIHVGELSGRINGREKERLCYLQNGKRTACLPKRCVFDTREAALVALNKRP